jgi:hypothetical protein
LACVSIRFEPEYPRCASRNPPNTCSDIPTRLGSIPGRFGNSDSSGALRHGFGGLKLPGAPLDQWNQSLARRSVG